jgi:uncharacterized phage protein (TIGR02220 family)
MANRRMFSKTIISSASFIKMPPSSQMLYFHLGLNADDDGVVEAFPVMRMVGASEDDLKILAAKKFVTILNDDFVSYINDWLEHNLIRKDRKIDSKYKELLVQIGACQPSDNQMSAQDRIGKVRLGKDNKNLLLGKPNDTPLLFNGFKINEPEFTKESYSGVKFPYSDYEGIRNLEAPTGKDKVSKDIVSILSKVVLKQFNWVTGSRFRPTHTNLALIEKCLSTGSTIGNCFSINLIKWREWKDDPVMCKYIRPGTLYALRNFEQYLGEIKTIEHRQENDL